VPAEIDLEALLERGVERVAELISDPVEARAHRQDQVALVAELDPGAEAERHVGEEAAVPARAELRAQRHRQAAADDLALGAGGDATVRRDVGIADGAIHVEPQQRLGRPALEQPARARGAFLGAGEDQDDADRKTTRVISAGVKSRMGGPQYPVPLLT
jgi:hypothetical protein